MLPPSNEMLATATVAGKRRRLPPLTIEEYESNYRLSASDLELVERVFAGSLADNQMRAALWPYLFGLIKHRGRFEKIYESTDEGPAYAFVEHEANSKRWNELKELYEVYQAQWMAILPEQELRFSTFRERKSLIERDVIRCDRLHLFYSDDQQHHLNQLTNLLMTYMMYDFDIGYVQGMSDLAAPILYVYQGEPVKSFWVFVEVMKLFRRNFEYSQKSIHFQLNCLYRLIKLTDPKLAYYLRDNDCSNCFFVFRCIVCQFKRELMKSNNNSPHPDQPYDPDEGYAEVLKLWDTIWCVQKRHDLWVKSKSVQTYTINGGKQNHRTNGSGGGGGGANGRLSSSFIRRMSQQRPRFELTETEKFVLSLCLSLIRRERNQILMNRLDASEIHQHFINPRLTRGDFDQFVDQAYEVYHYLNTDCDLQLLVKGANQLSGAAASDLSPICNDLLANGGSCAALGGLGAHRGAGASLGLGCLSAGADAISESETPDTYDLLKDYLIISPTSYNISLTSLNNLNAAGLASTTPPTPPSSTHALHNHHHHNHHNHHHHQLNGSASYGAALDAIGGANGCATATAAHCQNGSPSHTNGLLSNGFHSNGPPAAAAAAATTTTPTTTNSTTTTNGHATSTPTNMTNGFASNGFGAASKRAIRCNGSGHGRSYGHMSHETIR